MGLKKIGVIGTGWIFKQEHIRGYLATSSGYIHGFYDVSEEFAQEAIMLYKNGMKERMERAKDEQEKELCKKALEARFYSDPVQLIDEVDGVDICTPPQFHMYYAKIAAERGKAVLSEKPLARTYPDAEEALKVLEKVPFYIFTQVIYNPIFKLGKEIIESGKLGDIVEMRNCHATLDLSHTLEREAFWDPLKSGGGALKDIGPHAYSVMRYWLGKEYELKSVKDAGITTVVPERIVAGKPMKVIVDDKAIVDVEWQKTSEGGSGRTVKARLEAYWMERKKLPKELRLAGLYHEVIGTKAKMTFPHGTLGFILGKKPYFGIHVYFKIEYNDGRVEKVSMPQPAPHSEAIICIDEFISGVESRSPAWYGKDMMILLDSAYLSKKRGSAPITPEEYLEFIHKECTGNTPEERGEKLIRYLFDLGD